MNENLQKLEVKIENQGSTPQGKVSAAEWNILVAAVKALDAAGIDTETLAKYLKQYQYITTPELEELLKDVTENLDGVVDLKSAQTIEGLKDFINGFRIGGALVKYDTAKKCFVFTENVLIEKGLAWNSRFGDFTEEEIFSITKAVDVDWKTIGKNASGQLYVISGGGEGGGGNYDPDFLHNYLTNNKYITESALQPYAKTADVNSLLTDYVHKDNIGNYVFPIIEQSAPVRKRRQAIIDLNTASNGFYEVGYTGQELLNAPVDDRNGLFVDFRDASSLAKMQLYALGQSNSQALYYRALQSGTSEVTSAWKQIAFTDADSLSPASGKLHVYGNILATGNVSAQNVIINGKTISYNAAKNAFVLPANLLVEGGIAWNAKIDGFDVPTITDAVSIDGTSIIRDGGVLRVSPDYIQSVGGLNENELDKYLTNNNYAKKSDIPSLSGYATESFVVSQGYITQPTLADTLDPYASKADVNSLLTDYVHKDNIGNYVFPIIEQSTPVRKRRQAIIDLNTASNGFYEVGYTGQELLNAPVDDRNGLFVDFRDASSLAKMQLYAVGESNSQALYYRALQSGTSEVTSEWKQIAFTDGDSLTPASGALTVNGNITATKFSGALEGNADTATSATKLANKVKLWGQEFDGTSALTYGITIDSYKGVGTVASLSDLGNVGLVISADSSRDGWGMGMWTEANGQGYIQQQSFSGLSYPLCLQPLGGNVAIGGTTATEALHVHGNILATGKVAWNSSRVLKTEVKEHYLSLENMEQIKPYSYKWKDGRDDLVHVGAVADEVMEIMPETVLTDSLGIHSMDYAQTAFVMAASLTPHVSDHERRIKDLEIENEALRKEIETLKRVA